MKTLLFTAMLLLASVPAFAQEHQHGHATAHTIAATGTVVSIDAAEHTAKLKHDPIATLGWPAMTMVFTAQETVDLSGYQAGDAVSFTLTPVGQDDYILSGITKR